MGALGEKTPPLPTQDQVHFLSTVSHELRTPLNGILGSVQLLPMMGDLNESQLRAISIIRQSSQDLLVLIENILDLAQVQVDANCIRLTPFDIKRIVRNAVSTVQASAADKKVELFLGFSSNIEGSFLTDDRRVFKILSNVLNNAVKFTSKGRVTIKVRYENEQNLQFSISDTGIGISAENQRRIFAPFYQVETGDRRAYDGAGIGLSVARRFVLELGGEITVESELGKGSTFLINVPAIKHTAKLQCSGTDVLQVNPEDPIPVIG